MAKKQPTQREMIESLEKQVGRLTQLLDKGKVKELADHDDYRPSDSAYEDLTAEIRGVIDEFAKVLPPRAIAQALEETKFELHLSLYIQESD